MPAITHLILVRSLQIAGTMKQFLGMMSIAVLASTGCTTGEAADGIGEETSLTEVYAVDGNGAEWRIGSFDSEQGLLLIDEPVGPIFGHAEECASRGEEGLCETGVFVDVAGIRSELVDAERFAISGEALVTSDRLPIRDMETGEQLGELVLSETVIDANELALNAGCYHGATDTKYFRGYDRKSTCSKYKFNAQCIYGTWYATSRVTRTASWRCSGL